eukprot:3075719-Pleurochrysis_carterae.AAC.1
MKQRPIKGCAVVAVERVKNELRQALKMKTSRLRHTKIVSISAKILHEAKVFAHRQPAQQAPSQGCAQSRAAASPLDQTEAQH